MAMTKGEMRFLYRSDQGRIGRTAWWRAQAPLAVLLLALTLLWRLAEPFAHRSLAETQLIDARAFAAYTYLIFYAFAALLLMVCSYFVSAKRFRDRGRPAGFAGIWPLAALLLGALAWTQPQDGGMFPLWIVWAGVAGFAAVAAWSVYELGIAGESAAR